MACPPTDAAPPRPRRKKHEAALVMPDAAGGATAEDAEGASPYFAFARRVPLAGRLALAVRRRCFALFMRVMNPDAATRVLDLGASAETEFGGAQYFLEHYPWPERVVAAGFEDGGVLERRYGARYVRLVGDGPLPFADGAFDVVFANAVLEHAGDTAGQRRLASEIARVGRRFFATSPARFFPAEMHTAHLFLHWLPAPWWRGMVKIIGPRFYADESALHLLTARELAALFPAGAVTGRERYGLGGLGWRSHVAVWGEKTSAGDGENLREDAR